jgi:integrase
VRLEQLRPTHVEALILRMRSDGLAPSTIRQTYTVLRMALDDAVRDGLLTRNPASAVERPKVPRRDATALTIDQVRAVLDASAGHRLRPLLVLLVATACAEARRSR